MNGNRFRVFLLSAALVGAGAAMAEENQDSYDLSPRWEVGSKYVMRVESSQEMDIVIAPGAEPMRQTGRHAFTLAVAVPRALPDGGRELEMTYLDAAFSMDMGGQSISFDSRGDGEVDENNPLAVIRHMVGIKVTCVLDGDGRIQSVQGLKEFAARMTKGNPQAGQILESFLNTESFKRNFGGYFGIHWLPGKKVKIGEKWTIEDEVPMGALGTFVNRMEYELQELQDDLLVLNCTGTLSSKPGNSLEKGGMSLDLKVKNGKISGRTLFDPKRGTVTISDMKTVADIQVEFKSPDGVTQTMDQKLTQKYVAELVRVEDIK